MGGTLVDTYPALDATLRAVVAGHGHEVSERDVASLTRRSTGLAVSTLAERFDVDPAELRAAEAALKERWRHAPPPVMDGVHEAMRAARDLGGLNLVVTHRDRSSATSLLEGLGLVVDDMLCAPDGFPRKPDPAMYRELLARHALDADECLAVGDRPIDAEAAAGAGVEGAIVHTPGLDLDDGGARWRLSSLHEVADLLG